KSVGRSRSNVWVSASYDLYEVRCEHLLIEQDLAVIIGVPPADYTSKIQKRSDLLARTLALKPNETCFHQPVDTQFTCLTQTGAQSLLDDGHGQSVATALSSG